jgi:glutamate/tyrosine decarboxylase-like PLP-dependent enzyme
VPLDEAFRKSLHSAFDHAAAYLAGLEAAPVAATASLECLRGKLHKALQTDSLPPEQVIADLVRDTQGGITGCASGRFFGWVIGGSVPAALAADWLTAAWDQNAGMYSTAPAAAVVEEAVGAWLKDILGLPAQASFALTTGCQMAHATCLAAARHAVLARLGWDVEKRGLAGAPSIRVLSSRERHGSIERAVRLLGIGSENVIDLDTDEEGRLVVEALREALETYSGGPLIVLLQAGDLNIGAYDSFAELIPMAHERNAWVHIDGAFGLWAAASPVYRHFLEGAEQADSWATDGHKWLNVPYDCGYAFVADAGAHWASLSHHAAYLTYDTSARDEIDWNPEYSRRARGFPTYAALRQLGRSGIAELVERSCAHARALVAGIGELPGAEVVWAPAINQGLVRFGDDDARTDEVVGKILAGGEAFFTATTWRGRRVMRVSVCNWRTSEEDVRRAIAAVREACDDICPR